MKLKKRFEVEIDISHDEKYCGQDCSHLQESCTGKGAGGCGLFCGIVNSEELVAGIKEYIRCPECIKQFGGIK